jgi:hypothetical protein
LQGKCSLGETTLGVALNHQAFAKIGIETVGKSWNRWGTSHSHVFFEDPWNIDENTISVVPGYFWSVRKNNLLF